MSETKSNQLLQFRKTYIKKRPWFIAKLVTQCGHYHEGHAYTAEEMERSMAQQRIGYPVVRCKRCFR